MRRMNARYPNIALVGLLFVIILLGYKCWTLTSLDDDLRKEIEKLQTEVKINGMRQVQYENKNQQLQENIHELEEKKEGFKHDVDTKQIKLSEAEFTIKELQQEVNKLKTDLQKKSDETKDLIQQIEDKDSKIEELTSDSQHILSMKNDAEDALSEKDSLISNLKMEIEQMKKELSVQMHNKMFAERSSAHSANLLENKVQNLSPANLRPVTKHLVRTIPIGLQGMKVHPGMQMLPRQPSNAVRKKPKYSVADLVKVPSVDVGKKLETQNENVIKIDTKNESAKEKEKNNEAVPSEVLEKPNFKNQDGNYNNNNAAHQETQVEENKGNIPPPPVPEGNFNNDNNVLPQPHNLEGNLDTAVDDERKAVEDPADDQDEEGKEIKHDLENNNAEMYDNYDDEKQGNQGPMKEENNAGEPKGIGAAELPHQELNNKQNPAQDDVNLVDDIDQRANERLYEADFDSKIRNLGKL